VLLEEVVLDRPHVLEAVAVGGLGQLDLAQQAGVLGAVGGGLDLVARDVRLDEEAQLHRGGASRALERVSKRSAPRYPAAMELREIARDVYACVQEDRVLGTSNSGLVNRAGALVVDTFWDLPHTREMIETYTRVWRGPARRVVNTHHNGDHCWGNQLFP